MSQRIILWDESKITCSGASLGAIHCFPSRAKQGFFIHLTSFDDSVIAASANFAYIHLLSSKVHRLLSVSKETHRFCAFLC